RLASPLPGIHGSPGTTIGRDLGEAHSMLNQNERRRLEAIERQLEYDDPEFARRFSHWPKRSSRKAPSRLVLVLVLVAASLGVLLAMVASIPALFLASVVAGGGCWLWHQR